MLCGHRAAISLGIWKPKKFRRQSSSQSSKIMTLSSDWRLINVRGIFDDSASWLGWLWRYNLEEVAWIIINRFAIAWARFNNFEARRNEPMFIDLARATRKHSHFKHPCSQENFWTMFHSSKLSQKTTPPQVFVRNGSHDQRGWAEQYDDHLWHPVSLPWSRDLSFEDASHIHRPTTGNPSHDPEALRPAFLAPNQSKTLQFFHPSHYHCFAPTANLLPWSTTSLLPAKSLQTRVSY
jgi:hypothetical protein